MVELVGTDGLAAVDIGKVCEWAGASRAHFDRCFADLEDCFLSVHDELVAELCERVDRAREGRESWHDRIWATGSAAMRFLQEQPARAGFLVAAVNGAGERAGKRRDRIVQRLADLLDGGRGEAGGRGAMSRCTAEIAAGSVYGTVLAKIESGSFEREDEFLPELIYLAVMPYLGSETAEDELMVQPLR